MEFARPQIFSTQLIPSLDRTLPTWLGRPLRRVADPREIPEPKIFHQSLLHRLDRFVHLVRSVRMSHYRPCGPRSRWSVDELRHGDRYVVKTRSPYAAVSFLRHGSATTASGFLRRSPIPRAEEPS